MDDVAWAHGKMTRWLENYEQRTHVVGQHEYSGYLVSTVLFPSTEYEFETRVFHESRALRPLWHEEYQTENDATFGHILVLMHVIDCVQQFGQFPRYSAGWWEYLPDVPLLGEEPG